MDYNDYRSCDKAFPLKDLIKREHVIIAMIIKPEMGGYHYPKKRAFLSDSGWQWVGD